MAKVAERPVCGFIVPRIGCLILGWAEVILIMPLVLAGFIALGWAMFGSPWCLDVEQQTKFWFDAAGSYRYTGPVCVDKENWPNLRAILAVVALIIFACCGLLLSFPCCLLYGVNNRKPGCMIPYMVFGLVKASILLYFVVVLAIQGEVRGSILAGIFGHFVTEIYKISLVRCHYHHLINQQKEEFTDIWRDLEDRPRRAKVAIIDSHFLGGNNNTGYTKLADKPN